MPWTELPFAITVCGIEELVGQCERGATQVLSIVDPHYPVPQTFSAFGEHKKLELRLDDLIGDTEGKRLPNLEDVDRILSFGRDVCTSAVPLRISWFTAMPVVPAPPHRWHC
jgi:predicted protein tyrosine phosphatase